MKQSNSTLISKFLTKFLVCLPPQSLLQGLKAKITSVPSVNLGQLTANAGSGAIMQQFYGTLGTGARSSKVIRLDLGIGSSIKLSLVHEWSCFKYFSSSLLLHLQPPR